MALLIQDGTQVYFCTAAELGCSVEGLHQEGVGVADRVLLDLASLGIAAHLALVTHFLIINTAIELAADSSALS
jgi:hypothetical protein